MAVRLTQIEAEEEFKKYGCELLDNYKNNNTKMKFKCSCNNIGNVSLNKLQQGRKCDICKHRNYKKARRSPQENINQYFLDNNCECLDVYENGHKPMKYKCSCGNIAYISYQNFRRGQRCKECCIKKRSKENHWNWNEDRSKISLRDHLQNASYAYKKRYRKKYNIPYKSGAEIDHIFPICAFIEYEICDLDIINSEDNLQVLSKKENGTKAGNYDKFLFENYLINKNAKFKIKDTSTWQ